MQYLLSWKSLLVTSGIFLLIYGVLFHVPITSSFHSNERIRYKLNYSSDVSANESTTCATLLLKYCSVNHISLANCSWTIGTFRNHFYAMAALISKPFPESLERNRGLAFVRLGDGELMLMFGIPVSTLDFWLWPGGPNRLGTDLKALMQIPKEQYNSFSPFYYGVYDTRSICPIHSILTMIHQHPKYLSYANLFVNTNYPATVLLHQSIIKDEQNTIVLVINNETSQAKLKELKKWSAEIIQYPHNGTLMWEQADFREQAIKKIVTAAKHYRNRLFVFSVGPLSKVLIHYAWMENPYNRYVDFGSAFDYKTKNVVTRPYQSNPDAYQDPTYVLSYNLTAKIFNMKSV